MRASERGHGRTGEDHVPDYAVRYFEAAGEEEASAGPVGVVEVREAAAILGTSQRAVRRLVASGRLEAERSGEGAAARLRVSLGSLERVRSEQRDEQR